jgi:Uma2 family endonuclease
MSDMTVQTKPVTAEELLHMLDDGFRYELVNGKLKQMPFTGAEEGCLTAEIATELWNHAKANELGNVYAAGTGFQLTFNPDTVLAPDVAFVRRERILETGRLEGYRPGAPDLAMEVLSPDDTYSEVLGMVLEWLFHGTRLVLVVNPRNRTITAYRSREDIRVLTKDDTLDAGDVVPGWKLALAELFA